jgi:hypothetical protein
MILGKPMIACSATKQKGLVFAVPCTGSDVSFFPNFIIRAFRARAKIIAEIGHVIFLSVKGFSDCTQQKGGLQKKSNND